jgi:hypothetical protein
LQYGSKGEGYEEGRCSLGCGSGIMNNSFLRYSGMATQMAITIVLGVYLGRWLDEKSGGDLKVWTLTLSIVSVVAAMYFAIKDLMKK